MESVLRNLPPGWRFNPTNEELLDYYLRKKRLGHPFSESDIKEDQIYDSDPWDLIDDDCRYGERFFFCRRQFHQKSGGNQRKRKAKSSSWKRTGRIQDITREDSDEKIGTKSIFVYDDPNHSEYVMHEYELTEEIGSPVQDDFDFVLCKLMRIKKKKASKKPKEGGPLSEEKATINSKKKEAIGGSKRRKCAADAAFVSATCKEKQVMMANSAHDEGEQNNHPTSDIECENGSNHPTSDNGSNHPTSDIEYENGSNHPTSDIAYENGSNHPTSDSDHENGSFFPTSDLEYENGSNKRAYSAFGDGEPINHQSPKILVAAVSTWEKGEASHGGNYSFVDQNKFEATNTSICYEDTTSFSVDFDFNPNPKEASLGMNSDVNQNSSILNTLPGYSMSGTSQMMAHLENHSPNDSAAMSSHGRSSNLFDNENLEETIVSSTQKHVETCSLEEIDSHNSNQNGTVLYSACCDQSNLSSPVWFGSENQDPSEGTCVSASVRKDLPVDLECEYTDKSGPLLASSVVETEFEEVQSNYQMDFVSLDDLTKVTFPEIYSPKLEELTWLDVLSDTLSSEPQPIQTQNAPFGLW